jgi:hypothetical protein
MFLPLKPALLAASLVLIADGVPRFDVELFCRRIAAMAVALEEMEICLRKEREARSAASAMDAISRRRQVLLSTAHHHRS